MAKTAVINRDKKRRETVKKYAARRKELLETAGNQKLSPEERYAARENCRSCRADASPVRLRNRCALTGRPRASTQVGLGAASCASCAARRGPGVIKASW